MAKIKENLVNIKTSSTLEINELSVKLENEGKEIYKFGLGQSPFPVPDVVIKELQKNAFQKNYLNVSGLLELREHIAKYHTNKNKYNYEADDILIGPGSKELIFQTQLTIDCEILLPSPSWVTYEPQAQIIKNKIHWLETTFEQNWHVTAKELDDKCKKIKDKTKLLILNSPNNPSGTMHTNLKELALIAKSHEVIIIADEIYADLSFNDNYESITHFYPEGTIVSSGISKWCGAGGWRLGFLLFPKNLKLIRNVIRNIASETFTSVSAPIQYAVIKAYSEDHSEYLQYSRKILHSISNYVHKKFNEVGIRCKKPQGGFYMLCDFSSVLEQTNEINDSKSLCNKVLNETGFAMLPGVDFGISVEKLITRIAFVDFDGKIVLEKALQTKFIDEKFIINNCPKIVQGIKKLIDWVKQQK
tara:strand:- start:574 stop:1824 length:1251 start_codon:yes stop_codon:yes gene_type:complete